MFSQDYLSHTQMFLDLNIHKSSLWINQKKDINCYETNSDLGPLQKGEKKIQLVIFALSS
jgi:hypothetical protein